MISSPINETPSSPSQRYIVMIANWKLHICSGLAVLEILFGLITAISILPSCVVSGILQVICGLCVLAVESPALITPFVPQLKPMAAIFENRPAWQKCAAFSILFFIPWVIGCFGFLFVLGEIAALGIAAVYGVVVIGEKANLTDMAFQAGEGTGQTSQPYSPTSP